MGATITYNKKYFKKRRKEQISLTKFVSTPPFPKNALIELTNACNHACLFCKNSHQLRKPTYLSLQTYSTFIKQAVKLGLKEVGLYATGEPFMTKEIEKYILFAKNNGVERVYITTNGALAEISKVKKCFEAGLDSIKFSINASNKEDYKIIHGKDDFEKVLKNLKEIYNWKYKNKLNLQILGSCVLVPSMPHTKKEHFKIFNEYFDDSLYVESTSQGGQKFDYPLPENDLKKIFTTLNEVNEKDLKPCLMVFNRYHLTAEGYLSACCIDYNLNLVFSDINKENLIESWHNNVIKKLREKHINRKLDNTICHSCLTNSKKPYKAIKKVSSNKFSVEKFEKIENKLIKRFQLKTSS